MTNPTETIIVYHQVKPGVDCPDGICAAWVVARAIQESWELIGDSYLNNSEYELPEYQLPFNPAKKDVILVDFSYPKSILERIANEAYTLTILDHHKSRANDISSLSNRILGGYSADECGATFAWRHFHSSEPEPWFLRHVWRRDTGADGYYDGDCPTSEAIGAAMSKRRKFLLGQSAFKIFDNLLKCSENQIIDEGIGEIEERDVLVKEALNQYNGAVINVAGYTVPYYQLANRDCHRFYSIVGARAARIHTQAPFVAITTDEPLKISLRASSASDIDLGVIAKSLGGGGHAKAAGYTIKPAVVQTE